MSAACYLIADIFETIEQAAEDSQLADNIFIVVTGEAGQCEKI